MHFIEGNLAQFGRSAKINSGATMCFGFSGPEVGQIGPGVEMFPKGKHLLSNPGGTRSTYF